MVGAGEAKKRWGGPPSWGEGGPLGDNKRGEGPQGLGGGTSLNSTSLKIAEERPSSAAAAAAVGVAAASAAVGFVGAAVPSLSERDSMRKELLLLPQSPAAVVLRVRPLDLTASDAAAAASAESTAASAASSGASTAKSASKPSNSLTISSSDAAAAAAAGAAGAPAAAKKLKWAPGVGCGP